MLPPEIIEIEKKLEDSRKSYFEDTINFVKWTTTFAIAAALWFGANLHLNDSMNLIKVGAAFCSLLSLLISIVCAMIIFYSVTKYWNETWKMHNRHRSSLMAQSTQTKEEVKTVGEIATKLSDDDEVEKIASKFITTTYWHMVCLIIGISLFFGYFFVP